MSLVKFPTQIKPARLTVTLARVDETIRSPLTNVQQVVARGNPVWRWTYEYVDLSDSERDIVHAFLMKCRGSVNTFKITDPGDYEPKGSVSDWIDIFSGYGSFQVDLGSDTISINSWFSKRTGIHSDIDDERRVRLERFGHTTQKTRWKGHGDVNGGVNSLQAGQAYVSRNKYFQGPETEDNHLLVTVGSGNSDDIIMNGPGVSVKSSDNITVPFVVAEDVSSITVALNDSTLTGAKLGAYWHESDYRLARCAMVVNSENLLTESNNFDDADWSKLQVNVDSGYGAKSPTGVTSGGWKLFVDAQVNTTHLISQTVAKINTEDIYTLAVYARKSELESLQLRLDDGAGTNTSVSQYNLNDGDSSIPSDAGANIRGFSETYDVGSDWLRCQLTAVVSSLANIRGLVYLTTSFGGTDQFTGNGSDGIEIAHASLTRSPFMGPYVPTDASAQVGSGNWQTGSQLYAAGFDVRDVIKSGQRFEVVNQFHNRTNNLYERSEFKRMTEDIKVHAEGWALLKFDPPIRNAPVTDRSNRASGTDHLGETMHNPVIFHQPEMKGRLLSGTVQYTDKPLRATDISFDVLEDMTE